MFSSSEHLGSGWLLVAGASGGLSAPEGADPWVRGLLSAALLGSGCPFNLGLLPACCLGFLCTPWALWAPRGFRSLPGCPPGMMQCFLTLSHTLIHVLMTILCFVNHEMVLLFVFLLSLRRHCRYLMLLRWLYNVLLLPRPFVTSLLTSWL